MTINYMNSCKNFKTISCNFTFEFTVLAATIKAVHKFCSLFPSPNPMLLTRRRNCLLYFSLLLTYY